MSLEAFMIDALKQATEMAAREGVVRPTFVIASAEGVYTLVSHAEGAPHWEEDQVLHVVSALLRWSMTRAFVVTCEHEDPSRIAVYVVTADEAEGFSVSLDKRPLRFGDVQITKAPPDIRRLRALIPPPVSRLSPDDVLDLEEAFGMELEECRPYYVS
ncbi:hypothetical protein [Hyphomicrobium sp. CS1GBMeth3]|uniref:hypothetical protein n=1 Tax=Hyphomicrobium sp. CS1GBMeth3 TaxID=1892845 RepID=UPI0009315ED4|nr:hypothetical protein [Hyphomicrobium sp. CS1GBMeth3]